MKPTLTTSQQFAKSLTDVSDSEYRRLRTNFDNFIESTPQLKHFIECDENGVPIEPYVKTEDEIYADKNNVCRVISKAESQWYKAQKQVLFEGWFLDYDNIIRNEKMRLWFKSDGEIYLNNTTVKIESYSDLTKYNLTTNNNFKEMIYGK